MPKFGRMEKVAEIEIRVSGKSGNQQLRQDNYDIKHIITILQNVEDILFPISKKERPLITYDLEEGSVRHIFKTTTQTVLGFGAILSQIQASNSIDFLEAKTSRAIEEMQQLAREKNYDFELSTSLNKEARLHISPRSNFFRTENTWVDTELYFYGILKDAGGKGKANIHIDTDDHGYLTIETGKEFLKGLEENLLYKKYGVRATGKQNTDTGEIDPKSLKLIELIDYSSEFDEDYLNQLINKARKNWKGVDPDSWLHEIRGEYEQ
jgi:hypothetical protein